MTDSNELIVNAPEQDLLAGEAYIDNHFVYATQGQRFLNWLIDNLLLRFGLTYLTGMGVGFLIDPDYLRRICSRFECWNDSQPLAVDERRAAHS